MRGKAWMPSHTATLCVRVGMGWTDGRIAKELGFDRKTVVRRRQRLDISRVEHPCKKHRLSPLASLVLRKASSLAELLDNSSMYEPMSGCKLWVEEVNEAGYGIVRWKGSKDLAHRAAWKEKKGPIPKGLCVLHKCDVPACIETNHHFLGTRAKNIEDMISKGRAHCQRSSKHSA